MNDAKCVLVVGATAGIGRALALAIHDLPSKPTVIVAGRRQERLDELCSKSERIKGVQVDVTGGKDSLKEFSTHVTTHYPEVGRTSVSWCMVCFIFNFPCDPVGRRHILVWNSTSLQVRGARDN